MEIIIEDAIPEDSSLIADAIIEAIGEDISRNLAGGSDIGVVHSLFKRLAERKDTQYSYKNTRIAKSNNGETMGLCISYNGEFLKRLRRPFFIEANSQLNWNLDDKEIEEIPGETDENEFYLDTLMTLPKFRGKGVATALIKDASKIATEAQKPLGLLCDKNNGNAYRLYEKLGFKQKGLRPFAGHEMYHLILDVK